MPIENIQKNKYIPPQFTVSEIIQIVIFSVFGLVSYSWIVIKFCFYTMDSTPFDTVKFYVAFTILLGAILWYFVLMQRYKQHKNRLEDPSEVWSMFIEGETVEKRLEGSDLPRNFNKKKEELETEIGRLKDVGKKGWTDYQILSLSQMLVDFLKVDELIARSYSTLEDLGEYAEEENSKEYFSRWEKRVEECVNKINNARNKPKVRDEAAEPLRAYLKTIHEHVANYNSFWSQGKVIVDDIKIFGLFAIAIFLLMGLLPFLYNSTIFEGTLHFFNWGTLGIVGAISGVLWNLNKSNVVNVGDTKGREVLSKVKVGTSLGFVSGIVSFFMIYSKILDGVLFPDILITPKSKIDVTAVDVFINNSKAVFWGIASGFSFDFIFERLNAKVEEIKPIMD